MICGLMFMGSVMFLFVVKLCAAFRWVRREESAFRSARVENEAVRLESM